MKNEKLAYDKGYRVIDGVVYSFNDNIRKLNINNRGYLRFTVMDGSRTDNTRVTMNVEVHRLVAYQKYKKEMHKKGIEVRHFDGDSKNNLEDNILIGTHQQNMLDIPKDVRLKKSINAASHKRIFSDIDMKNIRDLRKNKATYKEIMEKYNISSKGTLHYILNNEYVTKK